MFGSRKSRAGDIAKTAADVITANLMIADASLTITYMNRAVTRLLTDAEADIRKELPGFSVAKLIGSSIDMFYRDSAQRHALAQLKTPQRETIRFGGRAFDLMITPLATDDGQRAGFAMEWSDAAIRLQNLDFRAQTIAIGRVQAVIEFNLDGTVITANENFLRALGYSLAEIQGKHHSMFVEASFRDSPNYREFWQKLNRGEFETGEFKRIGKGGREVWILASYNPVFDENGKPFKVVKFATDVTEQKLRNADFAGQIAAIDKSQAVIEFAMDGTVRTANANFLKTLGYTLHDIQGRHHSMFVDPAERDLPAYREFWAALNRGEYQTGEFRRVGAGGREVWIQASYNPIMDLNGRPFKVVKYASDVTAQVIARLKSERVRGMMEQVAAGAEELNASVREISEAMVKSKETAAAATDHVQSADHQAQRLTAAAASMSGILQMIGDITGQINLLALNATIESARAGEAGRGFAVVAAEVKNLANQAKQATDKIGVEIDSLNGISVDVVTALGTVRRSIEAVGEYVTSTAAAVEEQSVVTGEMSSSMQRAANEAAAIG
ncbi:PAS domain-containing methyl-accepting chemotaxis protein [Bradyrhizobium neotropicale]|uniref:methyl-accepting chemotaxis protein n=1 Tax=Bradyrhizobium neotropicale TaxID=1497615 RepID=UPI001AD6DA41|nr:PAS domain-containing methyl-accepting chemotaxis protein [Bradyrhizobium neotropicale]MBO4227136.1 PAS domain-containing protein [Bradyrhizobium neotropicale]